MCEAPVREVSTEFRMESRATGTEERGHFGGRRQRASEEVMLESVGFSPGRQGREVPPRQTQGDEVVSGAGEGLQQHCLPTITSDKDSQGLIASLLLPIEQRTQGAWGPPPSHSPHPALLPGPPHQCQLLLGHHLHEARGSREQSLQLLIHL